MKVNKSAVVADFKRIRNANIVAKRHDCTRGRVYNILSDAGFVLGRPTVNRKWTAKEDEIVLDGLRKGMSRGEIAAKLANRNRNMVIGRCRRLKVRKTDINRWQADRIERLEAEKQSIRTALMTLLSTSKSTGTLVQVNITLRRDQYEIYSGLAWDHPTPFADLPALDQGDS